MDADAPRTRSSATAAMPGLRLHHPDRESEPITVRFPRIAAKETSLQVTQENATVVLGTAQKSQAEIEGIRSGDVIVLDQSAESPFDLVWQDKLIARIELVKLEGKTVWRVVELAAKESREGGDE